MPKLVDACQEHFGTKDFYEIFELRNDCHLNEIKKAYYKLALQYHPDRSEKNEEKEQLNEKFKVVGKIYSILANADQRAMFDSTGTINEDDADDVVQPNYEVWLDLFTNTFKRVHVEDIKEFERTYKGSAEEGEDLFKSIYVYREGNINSMWKYDAIDVISDDMQIQEIIKEIIADEATPEHMALAESRRRHRRKSITTIIEEATQSSLIIITRPRYASVVTKASYLLQNQEERQLAVSMPIDCPTQRFRAILRIAMMLRGRHAQFAKFLVNLRDSNCDEMADFVQQMCAKMDDRPAILMT